MYIYIYLPLLFLTDTPLIFVDSLLIFCIANIIVISDVVGWNHQMCLTFPEDPNKTCTKLGLLV